MSPRSVAFAVLAYGLMGAVGLLGLPVALVSPRGTRAVMKLYIRLAVALLDAIAGVRVEVRGEVPAGPVVVAAKHQSMLDVLILFRALDEARFVVKRSLLYAPFFGLYTWRTGSVFIDRAARGQGRRVLTGLSAGDRVGQVVIYPQGTRVAPGTEAPYRRGAAMIAREFDRQIVPAATNAGHFWAKGGALRGPGVAVVEFLPALRPASDDDTTMGRLRAVIEPASERLGREAEAAIAGEARTPRD